MAVERSRVVIAGAGVAGLETALALQKLVPDRVSIELVAPEVEFTYRPLAVAEPFRVGEALRIPLPRLAAAAGAALTRGTVGAVAAEEKTLRLDDGEELAYDALVLALGAQPREAVPGALTFRGHEDSGALAELLDLATAGRLHSIVFAAPAGAAWPLPVYELALLTANFLAEHMTSGVEIALVTPEDRPLGLFGAQASAAVAELLEVRGVTLHRGAVALRFEDGAVRLAGGGAVEADAVVALPRLEAPPIPGVPRDKNGFVPTDEFGWVLGLTDVYAAGDLTQFPIKQGGIAAQQAEAVATAIAADVGHGRPEPFTPVLRGLLLTGMTNRFLRSDTRGGSLVDTEPLWWPPAKIVGRHLTPLLARDFGVGELEAHPPEDALSVEVELETFRHDAWTAV